MTHGPRSLISLGIFLLLALSLAPYAHGVNYSIDLNGTTFGVAWQINAWQNLSSFGHIAAYPDNLNAMLSGSDLSSFESSLQAALQSRVPTVTIGTPTVRIVSNTANLTCTTQCPLQWLNATVQFSLTENVPQNLGVAKYDVSWKAIRIGDDLKAGAISFNSIGQSYLISALAPFANFQPSPGRSMRLFVENESTSVSSYASVASKVVLLDLSAFQTPLEKWNHNLDLSKQTQSWTSPHDGGFSTVATLTFAEPGQTAQFVYIAAGRVSAQLTAPFSAMVKGDTMFVDLSNGFWDETAALVILFSLGALVATVVVDYRISKRSRFQTKSKKR